MFKLAVSKDNAIPLIVFVHLPKTAGSTVNRYLQKSHLAGRAHIEAWQDHQVRAKRKIRKFDWVSGHIALPKMQAFLADATPRPLQFYSAVRDPIKQIASHYNWMIEIFHKGPRFYNSHPLIIKEISQNIRRSRNITVEEIIEQLKKSPGLFLNMQSRYLLGEDVVNLSKTEIRKRLSAYEYVAHEAALGQLIQRMTGTYPAQPAHLNRSRYHIDPGLFRTDAMNDFLAENNATDQIVYELVKEQLAARGN